MTVKKKIRAVPVLTVIAALTAASAFLPFPAEAKDSLVTHLADGRAAFARICGSCHGLDKPEKKDMDRPAWEALITDMQAKGAQMSTGERELILDYLGIRNVFLAKCTTCHTSERILDRSQPFSGWEKTVERMRGMGPGLMTEEEARSIIAYLTAIRGAAPAAE